MSIPTDIAIIGAGPYGLSLAAHLAAADIHTCVIGQPMQFWRHHMPEGMVLKSEGFASTLWHPNGAFTLKDYCAEMRLPYQDTGLPVPLQTFCDYGAAFQKRFVPHLLARTVTRLDGGETGFRLQLDDGTTVSARRVVLATGIGSFAHVPAALQALGEALCTHSSLHRSLDPFIGKHILVIGGGASGVELAGLMGLKDIRVTLAARRDPINFCDPPRERSLLERLQAPMSGLGTGWRSLACATAPRLFYVLPRPLRHMIVRRHLGPAPGWTSREPVERHVRTLLGVSLAGAEVADGRAYVSVVHANGMRRVLEADHVIAATGFRVDMHRLPFISRTLMDRMRLVHDAPVLSPWFETSIPGLFVVGPAAANSFGPLLRFVYGAGFASRRLARHLARTGQQHTPARDRAEVTWPSSDAEPQPMPAVSGLSLRRGAFPPRA